MRARERESQYFNTVRGLLHRTQHRLRDCLGAEAVEAETEARAESEVSEEVVPVPNPQDNNSPSAAHNNVETQKGSDGNRPVGARSAVKLWQDAGHYVEEAIHFAGCLKMIEEYNNKHNLHVVHQTMLISILREQPEDPWAFACSFLKKVSDDSTQMPALNNQASGRASIVTEHILEDEAIVACIDKTNNPRNKQKANVYMEKHDLIKSLQKAFTGVGRVQPQEPLIWLQEFFLSRHGSNHGNLAPDWVQVRAPGGSVYWVDLVSGEVEIEKPPEAGISDDIWEQTDATAMQAVIRDLRRGNMEPEDATEWVRMKFMKKVRLMNCVLKRGAHEKPGWGGTLREADAETLKELERYIFKGHGVQKDLLREVSKVDVTSIRMLKRVFVSFAESSADRVDFASISRDRFLELLDDLELCNPDAPSSQCFSLDSTLGEKFLRKGDELTKKDAEAIFDLIVAGVQQQTEGVTINVLNPEMSFSGFLVSLQMIAKRTR